MNRLFLLILISISAIGTASANEFCRSLVVDTYNIVGAKIDPLSFSSTTFEELNISIDEFNVMDSEDQQTIYDLVKPMSVMVEDTIGQINSIIERYSDTPLEFLYSREIKALRGLETQLRSCESL